jgi:hypothetical protein
MNKTISFKSIEPVSKMVRCTFIAAGEPIGHGVEGNATVHKVVIESWLEGTTGGEQRVVKASTLALVSGEFIFAPILGTTLSKTDAAQMAAWTRFHISHSMAPCPVSETPPMAVAIRCVSNDRYAVINARGSELTLRLSSDQTDAESLRAVAQEFRNKARHYDQIAEKAEAAAMLCS